MTTCDMCGGFIAKVEHYTLLLEGETSKRTVHTLDMCEACKKKLCEALSDCVRCCRVSSVSNAIRGLTSDQVSQVEAYIAQIETKKQELK